MTLAGRACVVRYQPYSDPDGRREAEALANAGFDTTLLCLRKDDEPARETRHGVTIRRFRLPKQRGGLAAYLVDYGLWFLVCAGWMSWQQIRKPFTVVQVTSLPDFQVFAALVPRLGGATIVLFLKEPAAELVESTDGPRILARAMRRISRLAIRFADLTFTVTEQHRELYVALGAAPADIEVIENTPPPEFLGVTRDDRRPSERFVAVCHGTIEARYGHDTIIDAAQILRDRGADVRFVITGSGTWADEMERRILDRDLQEVVDWRGYVSLSELREILATASVGIVAQHDSPYSRVVHTQKMYECFNLGLPVVASRLESTATYFGDAIEFFTPGDATSLADALQGLAENSARRADLVAAADRAVAEYSWPNLEARYLDAIRSRLR